MADVLIDEDGMLDPQALLRLQSDGETAETAPVSDGAPTPRECRWSTLRS
ncbi:MAG: hypothetical protein ACOCUO_01285 [archaeon]